MKTNENIAILLLLVSAVVLTGLLVAAYVGTGEPAYADSPDRAGDYIWVTGAIEKETDLLYVIDIAGKQLNIYQPNRATKKLDMKATPVDLNRAFRAGH